ncbi:MAG TPA: DnaJ C-terminal domain-containing protein [Ramlibacter sp.]|nr:DnaJ C-terminal domain-containing protein [Ramlibacter sp.]
MKYKDYYAALGVPREADADTIKKAYRKLARRHHPDVSKDVGAEAQFKDVAEAYATLKDPVKRAAYDELGARPPGEEFSPPPQWQHEFAGGEHAFEGMDLQDLFAALRRGQRFSRSASVPLRGRDYEATVRLTLEEAHRGATVEMNIEHEDGARTLAVTIPAGSAQGQRLRLRGKGGLGQNGAPAGDIYLHITLAPHAVFRPDGHDLYFDLALTPWEAALGASIEVPTLDGPVLLTVPPGTQSTRKLRLRSRGMASGHGGRGDLYAVARIEVPAALTPREHELFAELARVSTFDPRRVVTKEAGHAI